LAYQRLLEDRRFFEPTWRKAITTLVQTSLWHFSVVILLLALLARDTIDVLRVGQVEGGLWFLCDFIWREAAETRAFQMFSVGYILITSITSDGIY